MTPTPANEPNRFLTKESFNRRLIVEVAASCPIDEVALDICRKVSERVEPNRSMTFNTAARLILEAKSMALEHLLTTGSYGSRLKDFFDQHIRSLLGGNEDNVGWRAVCLALQHLGQPCEYLLIDYYIRGFDRPAVPNRWTERAKCTRRLRELVTGYLA